MPKSSPISEAFALVQRAGEEVGIAELSRRSGVPYSSARDLIGRDKPPKMIAALERLHGAAAEIAAEGGLQ